MYKKYAESLHSGRNSYKGYAQSASFIQTLLSVSELHRFCDLSLADFTAGREFHPALKPLLKREYHIHLLLSREDECGKMYLFGSALQKPTDGAIGGSVGDISADHLVFVNQQCGVDRFGRTGVIGYLVHIAHNGLSCKIC